MPRLKLIDEPKLNGRQCAKAFGKSPAWWSAYYRKHRDLVEGALRPGGGTPVWPESLIERHLRMARVGRSGVTA